jgi:hypothetical protein
MSMWGLKMSGPQCRCFHDLDSHPQISCNQCLCPFWSPIRPTCKEGNPIMPTRRTFASLAPEQDQKKNEKPLKEFLQKAKGLNFYEFWDLLGRPEKHNKKLGVLSYETTLLQILERSRHLCCLKPVGSGITEFCLRFLLFKIMTSNIWQNTQVCVVVGPSIRLADRILGRIRRLLEPHGIIFDSARGYLEINKCEIFSVPSHNLNSLRSLENPSCLYISEADYLPELSDVRECTERYISKSNPFIIMESTISNAVGLYGRIFKEEPCLYERYTVNYLDALKEGMYTEREIKKAMTSRSHKKELLCDINAAATGSTFPPDAIAAAYQNYNPNFQATYFVIACDPGWNPARTGICLLGVNAEAKCVVSCDEYSESEDDMVSLILGLYNAYSVKNIYVDASDKRFIKRLKSNILGERTDYEEYAKFLKDNKILSQYNPIKNLMRVVPLLFNQQNSGEMLSSARVHLEERRITIPANCTTLQNALLSATDLDGQLIKGPLSQGHGADALDSFRMSIWGADQ